MQLTKNFTLKEMIHSVTAHRRGITEQFNPPRHIIEELKRVAVNVAQPLRDDLGFPIRITSGYRSPRLNSAVRGSSTSDHMEGTALDMEAFDEEALSYMSILKCPHGSYIAQTGKEDYQFKVKANAAIGLTAIYNLDSKFDQVIFEYGTDQNPSWVHIGIGKEGEPNRGQILRKRSGEGYIRMTKEEVLEMVAIRA